jgi:DNA-binding SARP family transcriptional activator
MVCAIGVVSHVVSEPIPTRIQLCGRLVVRIRGIDVTGDLPGAQGRMLFAYLVANRSRQVTRDELADVLWVEAPPSQAATALRALLSKLRRALAVGEAVALGSGELLQLTLPGDAWVDTEAATQALHDAQSAVAKGEDVRAWIASHIAFNVASRVFLAGLEGDWISEQRAALGEIRLGALETLAACALRLGGPERDTAVRAATELIGLAPYRESGYVRLMEGLAAQGNASEALLVFERLRVRLREDLGSVPGPEVQALHARLLGG